MRASKSSTKAFLPYAAWLTVLAVTFTLGSFVAVAVLGLICVHIYLTRHKSTIFKCVNKESPLKAYVPVKIESYMSGATLNSGSFTIELVTGLPWVSTVHTARSGKNSTKNNKNECELLFRKWSMRHVPAAPNLTTAQCEARTLCPWRQALPVCRQ
ncbi:uncharacterized protein LOC127860901 [Dreissena polymorpha]|uniref:uncharacterized protein LOC127860901 n=1 Tax=Dreissena polymorpha TaxID=45954 RepID=UPI002264C110|nr:uncharacterized protein LOC127860901 [Dreissena polymorpha]XP_052255169.1 uncharacterized protein LOC127860901 [Dreissena polymorpha]XP_052255170.1 uncharacterized protein LOC127860901 [Dreissena polymorpha]